MNETGLSEEQIRNVLNDSKGQDLKYGRVLSSMCTYPHEIAVEAHMQFIESNMGDFGLFRGTYNLENEILGSLGDLLHHSEASGYMTTGGTESNIQAIRSMRNIFQRKDKCHRPNLVVPDSAHFSFDKVSDILDIELRKASLDKDLKVSIESVMSLIDENTIGLVAIAGSTEFGQVDQIDVLSDIAIKNNIFLHVDAAFGGFVLPFLEDSQEFDFSLPGVTSIAIDPHKMGLSTIPAGVLLFRSPDQLESLKADTPYLTVSTQYTLTGTRSGAAVAATWAVMNRLGKEGYRKVVSDCMSTTHYLLDRLAEIGVYPLIEPVMNVVALEIPEADLVRSRLAKEFNWQVSITQNPHGLRLVIMPHVTIEMLDSFVQDLKKVLDTL
ncbi:tyrosine decarboxylase MfnA [Methanolobus profundi]|uniref:Probable L-tyrosine/L-aspartate decarboxylase n=1 Tax=Methanolobus profundi TaxID=487685 RepID=A0A1I4T4T5_9EURY|nr:tyrosine decarboxylase MfnA [Methanolobus profundi]SFM71560.1 tyrosine decarboxylase / aspartate 1-decarboxylase [Methanolobus profundi]